MGTPRTLEDKKERINHLFGFPRWKSHVTKRPLSERSRSVRELYMPMRDLGKSRRRVDHYVSPGNVAYTLLLGWWLSLIYAVLGALLCVTVVGAPLGRVAFEFAFYFFWPFGRFVEIRGRATAIGAGAVDGAQADGGGVGSSSRLDAAAAADSESDPLLRKVLSSTKLNAHMERQRNRDANAQCASSMRMGAAHALWWVVCVPVLSVAHFVAAFCSWMSVVMIPMAKVSAVIAVPLFTRPLSLTVRRTADGPSGEAEVLVCTYQAVNVFYRKYSVGGMNVCLVNLLPFVIASLLLGYVPQFKELVR